MKRIYLIGLLAALVLVAACGKQNKQETENHGPHGEQSQVTSPSASSAGEHGEAHGEEQASETKKLETNAVWKWSEETPKSGENTLITVQIQDTDGKAIEEFDINHEKKLHLIAVSKDLSYFDHIHPEYKGNGQFEITTSFPSGGDYKLFADYIPTGGSATTKSEWIKVEGLAAEQVPIKPSDEHSVIVDGVEITLENNHPEAGKEIELNFKLSDAKSQDPITDLEPYLGAVGHVVILSEDTEQYLHVHPMEEKAKGPDAKFMTTFPNTGVYKIWGQFQRNGKTFISPFVVEVK
ncbi:hypothetical protein [Paenibacillus macquariensis]|uniref:Secreted protein n=1 Tax=Paenibacillus macquariensis TaxID=948756 RepID=A0ABY1KCH7_9BACL|nr:hypothetical protein [Paenibacillus macquariensis]OAB33085.1 hypothetical protein PMSM_16140 [Paenibacillus macquariensis subsp. macquariensis]SIR59680.1 hypothetical protein SAMN05421578_12161 [Paenibacillus macquariensis]